MEHPRGGYSSHRLGSHAEMGLAALRALADLCRQHKEPFLAEGHQLRAAEGKANTGLAGSAWFVPPNVYHQENQLSNLLLGQRFRRFQSAQQSSSLRLPTGFRIATQTAASPSSQESRSHSTFDDVVQRFAAQRTESAAFRSAGAAVLGARIKWRAHLLLNRLRDIDSKGFGELRPEVRPKSFEARVRVLEVANIAT